MEQLGSDAGDLSARGSLSARQSQLSSASSSTFRDTAVEQAEADSLMHAQSLTSIVNNPKKDSLLRKVKNMVKQKVVGSSVPKFKALSEA